MFQNSEVRPSNYYLHSLCVCQQRSFYAFPTISNVTFEPCILTKEPVDWSAFRTSGHTHSGTWERRQAYSAQHKYTVNTITVMLHRVILRNFLYNISIQLIPKRSCYTGSYCETSYTTISEAGPRAAPHGEDHRLQQLHHLQEDN